MRGSELVALASLILCTAVVAGEPAKPADTTILALDKGSFVGYLRWKTPPVVTKDGKLTPLLEPARKGQKEEERKPWPPVAADAPAKDWASPDFDDGRWVRLSEPLFLPGAPAGQSLFYVPGTPVEWNLFCLRGRFRVEDPAQVRDLRLLLRYVGGVRVLVNGQELCRGHLTEGTLDFDTPAEVYPDEAYAQPGKKADGKELMKVRTREMASKDGAAGVAIPAGLLRKGINVLAVEAHAAPLPERMFRENHVDNLNWSHAGVLEARLSAAGGVAANTGPAPGIELWTSQQMATDYAWHYAHPADRIRPVRMVGAQNGTFSGKVVMSSAAAIKNLKASVSELVGADGKGRIPAAATQVRWHEKATPAVRSGLHWDVPCRADFDRLLTEFPAEIPALSLRPPGAGWSGTLAVVPVWITVRVPADAPPGEYRGTLSIEAQGAAPARFAVPVELRVNDWRIPDPKDFSIHHNIYQSPDTVARYYKVPLWSDKHFELMGKSLDLFGQVGNKLCVLCLAIGSPAMENAESMVRWVKKEGPGVSVQVSGSEKKDGPPAPDTRNLTPDTWSYDFSILDKYLDLYAAKCGKPGILQLNVWENSDTGRLGDKNRPPPPPLGVTVFDPATGKTEPMAQPPYGTPENEAFWRPVFAELRKRLEKRGWFDVTAHVDAGYCLAPLPGNVTVFKRLWADGKWMSATHSCPDRFEGVAKGDVMPCPYVEWVWGAGSLHDPDYGDRKRTPFYPRAWKRGNERILLANVRYGNQVVRGLYDGSPFVLYRTVSEAALQGGLRGIGRVGGDFWPLPAGKPGEFRAIGGNYGGCSWRENVMAMTSPGPDGASFNARLEAFREGVQTAEAVIFVQRALDAGKVGEDLAKRAAALLDERARYYLRAYFYFNEGHLNNGTAWACSNWQERDGQLFALAAEVAKATGGK
jgi:hypothetical protein